MGTSSAPTRWLSTLPLLAASLLATPAGAVGRDSCPLTTIVSPFQATANARYEIVLTDGGDGDSDGEVNGLCDAAMRVCHGEMPLCTATPIVGAKVRTSGGWNRIVRHRAEEEMEGALEGLTTGDACGVARFSLAAEEDASVIFRFRVSHFSTTDYFQAAPESRHRPMRSFRRTEHPAGTAHMEIAGPRADLRNGISTRPPNSAADPTPPRAPAPAPKRAPAPKGRTLPNPPEYPPVGTELAINRASDATAPTTHRAPATAAPTAPAAPRTVA